MKKIVSVLIIIFIVFAISGCGGERKGKLSVNSVPEGADVYIDNVFKGKTPLVLTLPYGEYELLVKKAGYDSKKAKVVLNKDESFKIVLSKPDAFNVTLDIRDDGHYPKPSRFAVYIDGCFTEQVTPCVLKGVTPGKHTIKLVSLNRIYEKKFDLESNIEFALRDFKALEFPVPYYADLEDYSGRYAKPMTDIVFENNKPYIGACCSSAAFSYSGIFTGETVNLKGYIRKGSNLKGFDIVFPSGKKVHINTTEKNGVKVFSKKVTFDEVGKYSGFSVLYRAIPLSPGKTVEDLFGAYPVKQICDAVAIPENSEQTIRLFVTDGNGLPVINKPIGKYGLKTDGNGIVTLKVKGKCGFEGITVNGEKTGVRIYGYLLGWVYHSTVLDLKDTDVKYVNGDVYIPKSQVLGYFSEEDIKQTKTINGKTYANLDTLKSGNGASVIITNDKIKFLKMCDMVP